MLYELATLQRPFRGGSVSGAPEGCFAVQLLPCSGVAVQLPDALNSVNPGSAAIAVKILRGSYAPLSSERYSAGLHQLVAALLRRKPDQRPSMDEASGAVLLLPPGLCALATCSCFFPLDKSLFLPGTACAQVLSMDYVRQHMRRYRDHVQQAVERRKQSYFHSLDAFQLDSSAADLATAHLLNTRAQPSRASRAATKRLGSSSRGGMVASLDSKLESDSMPSSGAAAAAGVDAGSLGTVVINASSAELASASAAEAAAAAAAAAMAPGPRAQPPKHTTFSAVLVRGQRGAAWQRSSGSAAERLAAAAAAARRIQQQPEQLQEQQRGGLDERRCRASFGTTDSPQSHFFDSLDTTSTSTHSSSGAAGGDALISATQLPGVMEQDGGEEAAASLPSPSHVDSAAAVIAASADAVGDLARRVPLLLEQVQQLLQGPSGVDEGQEGREERRLSRRAAVQECQEELFGSMNLRRPQPGGAEPALPPPAFATYPPR